MSAATLAWPQPAANLALLVFGDALGMRRPLSKRIETCHALATVITLLSLLSADPAAAEKRIALVVGNSAYQNIARLDNPRNDATLMAETLLGLGFTLIGERAQLDLDKAALDTDVQNFGRQIQGADVALFYYAGHGVQLNGSNYLVPVGANPTREADVDFQMVDINLVLRQMQGSGTRLNMVILDACRNNPFGGRGLRSADGGLAQMRAPEGTLISYATQPGSVAQDGSNGHSPYTKALATTIKQAGLDIFQTFNQVGLAVKRETGGSQQPWVSSSPIDGSFYFVAPAAGPKVAAVPQPQSADTLRPAPDFVPPPSRETEPPRGSEGGGSNFDGTWAYTGIGTNCRGSGSGFLAISGGLVSSKRGVIGRIGPDGAYRSASVGDDGVALTSTGRMSGNAGSGSYRRADGCNGRWTAKRL
jgi:Caspase domain